MKPRFFHALSALLLTNACAYSAIPPQVGNRSTEQPATGDLSQFFGEWMTGSRNYESFGLLKISDGRLSWGECKDTPIVVKDRSANETLVELRRIDPCQLRGDASFLIFRKIDERRIEVSICRDEKDFLRASRERLCSMGIMGLKD